MKRFITTLTVALCLCCAAFSQTITNFDPVPTILGLPGIGQTFTATMDGFVNQIDVKSSQSYSNIKILIYNSSNGSGNSGNSAGFQYQESGFQLSPVSMPDPTDWNEIILTTPFPIVEGNVYTFILENVNTMGAIDLASMMYDNYLDGMLISNYGSTMPIYDLNFRIWETPSVIPNPPVSTPLSAIPLVIMLACLAAIIFYRLI